MEDRSLILGKRAKLVLSVQNISIGKIVSTCIWEHWLYLGKKWLYLSKIEPFRQIGYVLAKLVLFRAKLLLFGQNGSIWAM